MCRVLYGWFAGVCARMTLSVRFALATHSHIRRCVCVNATYTYTPTLLFAICICDTHATCDMRHMSHTHTIPRARDCAGKFHASGINVHLSSLRFVTGRWDQSISMCRFGHSAYAFSFVLDGGQVHQLVFHICSTFTTVCVRSSAILRHALRTYTSVLVATRT